MPPAGPSPLARSRRWCSTPGAGTRGRRTSSVGRPGRGCRRSRWTWRGRSSAVDESVVGHQTPGGTTSVSSPAGGGRSPCSRWAFRVARGSAVGEAVLCAWLRYSWAFDAKFSRTAVFTLERTGDLWQPFHQDGSRGATSLQQQGSFRGKSSRRAGRVIRRRHTPARSCRFDVRSRIDARHVRPPRRNRC